jgi:hypothetical protein
MSLRGFAVFRPFGSGRNVGLTMKFQYRDQIVRSAAATTNLSTGSTRTTEAVEVQGNAEVAGQLVRHNYLRDPLIYPGLYSPSGIDIVTILVGDRSLLSYQIRSTSGSSHCIAPLPSHVLPLFFVASFLKQHFRSESQKTEPKDRHWARRF